MNIKELKNYRDWPYFDVSKGGEKYRNNRNSDGQEVMEPGKHAENVYLKDCPFVIGKDQVEFFKLMQDAKEKHTIDTVDDFMKSARMNEGFDFDTQKETVFSPQEHQILNCEYLQPDEISILDGLYLDDNVFSHSAHKDWESFIYFDRRNIVPSEYKTSSHIKIIDKILDNIFNTFASFHLPEEIEDFWERNTKELGNKIVEYLKNFTEKFDTPLDAYLKFRNNRDIFVDNFDKFLKDNNVIKGRVFHFEEIGIPIVLSWAEMEPAELFTTLGYSRYYAQIDELQLKYFKYPDNNYKSQKAVAKLKEQEILHNIPANEKWKKTAAFRKIRDEKNAQELKKYGYKTTAERNFYTYAESLNKKYNQYLNEVWSSMTTQDTEDGVENEVSDTINEPYTKRDSFIDNLKKFLLNKGADEVNRYHYYEDMFQPNVGILFSPNKNEKISWTIFKSFKIPETFLNKKSTAKNPDISNSPYVNLALTLYFKYPDNINIRNRKNLETNEPKGFAIRLDFIPNMPNRDVKFIKKYLYFRGYYFNNTTKIVPLNYSQNEYDVKHQNYNNSIDIETKFKDDETWKLNINSFKKVQEIITKIFLSPTEMVTKELFEKIYQFEPYFVTYKDIEENKDYLKHIVKSFNKNLSDFRAFYPTYFMHPKKIIDISLLGRYFDDFNIHKAQTYLLKKYLTE